MPGPSYQQFQSYPNVVGNYFAGRDAGYGRAKETFGDQQTLETQNALVQQSGAQSYPQLQAMQMQAQQTMAMYTPALQSAVENENYEMRDAIVAKLRKSGNPILMQFADVAATVTKADNEKYGYDISFTDEKQRQAAWEKDPFLQAAYSNVEDIPLNTPFRVESKGMMGKPGSHTVKFEAVSRMQSRPSIEHYRGDSVSTLEGLQMAVAETSPEIARKILVESVDRIKKGYTVVLERDSRGALTGLIRAEKRPPAAGAGVAGGAVDLTEDAQRMMAIAAQKGIVIPVPSFGMGVAAVSDKKRVLNRMAADLVASGRPMDAAVSEVGLNKAGRAASEGELKKIKAQRGPVMAFAKTAELNLKRAIDMVDKIPESQLPVVNRALRSGAAKISGDPQTAAFYAALYTGVTEYAKVLSSATGGGTTTNAAREEAADALGHGGYTAQQYKTILKTVLLPDLMSRKQGYDERIAQAEKALRDTSGVESGNSKGNIAPAGTKAKLKDGRIVISDGQGGWK
jgi:hypothetical protein